MVRFPRLLMVVNKAVYCIQIKLVAVQRFFDRIDNYIHLVIGENLRAIYCLFGQPSVNAVKIVWRYGRRIQMMKRQRLFSCIYTSSQHAGRNRTAMDFFPHSYH
jgi:hypothetical protein